MVSLCRVVCRAALLIIVYGFMIVSSIFIHCVFVQDEILNGTFFPCAFKFYTMQLNIFFFFYALQREKRSRGIDYEEIVNYCRLLIWVKWVML